MPLTCPKCQGTMRTYERNGVTVEQCSDCRGLFLDRGELEHLIDAENRWHRPDPPPQQVPPQAPPQAPPPQHAPYGQGHYGHGQYGYKKRRKSFLEELFD